MNSSILNLLTAETTIEKEQKKNNHYIADIPSYARLNKSSDFTLQNKYFFANKDIYISKHNRYADYPAHTHQFLEINYMVSGNCHQTVDGHEILLHQHDLLLIDIGCTHTIKKLNTNDIMINILFQNTNISIDWLNNLKKSQSLLYSLLLNRSYGEENINHFILFKHNNHSQINSVIENLVNEYVKKRPFYNEVISSYLQILLTELVRNYQIKPTSTLSSSQKTVTEVLHDIEHHYREITLTKEAAKLGYNKNYLSNLLKNKTGKSFSGLLTYQRLINARLLLTSTNQPIRDIMEQVGITNKTFFYKKYKEQYSELPGKTRTSPKKILPTFSNN